MNKTNLLGRPTVRRRGGRERGATVVLAVSAGRTVRELPDDPFAVATADLDGFEPIDL